MNNQLEMSTLYNCIASKVLAICIIDKIAAVYIEKNVYLHYPDVSILYEVKSI